MSGWQCWKRSSVVELLEVSQHSAGRKPALCSTEPLRCEADSRRVLHCRLLKVFRKASFFPHFQSSVGLHARFQGQGDSETFANSCHRRPRYSIVPAQFSLRGFTHSLARKLERRVVTVVVGNIIVSSESDRLKVSRLASQVTLTHREVWVRRSSKEATASGNNTDLTLMGSIKCGLCCCDCLSWVGRNYKKRK